MDEIGEAELIRAYRSGAVIEGAVGGVKRAAQAAVLRKCCHELKGQIDPRGLRLNNAVVAGCLDPAGLAVALPLRFDLRPLPRPAVQKPLTGPVAAVA